jgi:hypothetical protein
MAASLRSTRPVAKASFPTPLADQVVGLLIAF